MPISATSKRHPPGRLRNQRDLRRAIGLEIRQAREDAGVSQALLARHVGISQGYLSRIESGEAEATVTVLAQIARVLGGRLRVRFEPGSGPLIRDHLQAAMLEALLPLLHPRWARFLEVPVHRPVRGLIDLVLADPTPNLLLATEVHSQVRRLEQQVRWANEKAAALANEPQLTPRRADDPPTISRLLVLRSTQATRALARNYGHVLTAAYPADPREIRAALTSDRPWPGAGIIWMEVDHGVAHLIDRRART
ncbi:MAG: helix-turn-helix domain-containing protein [Candidatus Limnocylindrales bacterium]